MKKLFQNWLYGDNTPIPLSEIDKPLLARLRSQCVWAVLILFGFLLFALLFDAFLVVPLSLLSALYFAWDCMSLYRAVQHKEVAVMLCCITEVRSTSLIRNTGNKMNVDIILLNEKDEELCLRLPNGRSIPTFEVEDFVLVYYNSKDGIVEYDGYHRFCTFYAIQHSEPDE